MKNNHYYQLDVFRALAALSVCAVHFNFDSFFGHSPGNTNSQEANWNWRLLICQLLGV